MAEVGVLTRLISATAEISPEIAPILGRLGVVSAGMSFAPTMSKQYERMTGIPGGIKTVAAFGAIALGGGGIIAGGAKPAGNSGQTTAVGVSSGIAATAIGQRQANTKTQNGAIANAKVEAKTMANVASSIMGGFRDMLRANVSLPDLFTINIHAITAGSANAGLAKIFSGGYNFGLVNCSPTTRDIQSIDDFFTAYGYRVDRFMIPIVDFSKNIGNNGCFYLKTASESCCTSLVREAQVQFDAMCNAGIRFWKTDIGKTISEATDADKDEKR